MRWRSGVDQRRRQLLAQRGDLAHQHRFVQYEAGVVQDLEGRAQSGRCDGVESIADA